MRQEILLNKTTFSISPSLSNSRLRYFDSPYLFCQKAFTLIEVLFVIAIIGIVSAIAVPNMTVMMKSYRLKSAANDLASTLQLARLTAISQNAHSVVIFNPGTQSYSTFSDNGEGGGTLNDGVQSGTEPTIKTISIQNEYAGEITLGTPSFGSTNFFTAQGSSNTAGSIVLQNNSGESYQVVVSLGGSIKTVKL